MGILARTTQLTSGSDSRSLGAGDVLVSTGMERGPFCDEGVSVPGVEGGVKAGLKSAGGGSLQPCWSRLKAEI